MTLTDVFVRDFAYRVPWRLIAAIIGVPVACFEARDRLLYADPTLVHTARFNLLSVHDFKHRVNFSLVLIPWLLFRRPNGSYFVLRFILHLF